MNFVSIGQNDAKSIKIEATRKHYNDLISESKEAKNKDSTLYWCDRLIQFEKNSGDGSLLIYAKLKRMDAYKWFNKPGTAYVEGLELIEEYCENEEYCRACSRVYNTMTDLALDMSNYKNAIHYQNEICWEGTENRRVYKKAKIYLQMNEVDSAFLVARNFINKLKNNGTQNQLRQANNVLGLVARNAKRYDEAIPAFEEAIRIANEKGQAKENHGYLYGNLAECYMAKNNHELAYEYFLIDAKWQKQYRYYFDYVKALLNLSTLELKFGKYGSVKLRLTEILEMEEKQVSPEQRIQTHKLMMDFARKTNNSTLYDVHAQNWELLTTHHLRNVTSKHQDLVVELTRSSIEKARKANMSEKQVLEQKLVLKEQEKSRKNLQLWILGVFASLIIVIIVVFIIRYRARQRNADAFNKMELEAANNREEILEFRIKQQNFTVQAQSMELKMKEEFADVFIDELKSLDSINKPDLNHLQIFIQNQLEIKSTRAELENELNNVKGSFYDKLRSKYPHLLDSDIQLAAMVFMKLRNKDIAQRRNIAVESAKMAKNRLKKKMDLRPDEDLAAFLQELISNNDS